MSVKKEPTALCSQLFIANLDLFIFLQYLLYHLFLNNTMLFGFSFFKLFALKPQILFVCTKSKAVSAIKIFTNSCRFLKKYVV